MINDKEKKIVNNWVKLSDLEDDVQLIKDDDDTPYTVAEVRNDPDAKNYDWSLAELLDTKVTDDRLTAFIEDVTNDGYFRESDEVIEKLKNSGSWQKIIDMFNEALPEVWAPGPVNVEIA